MILHLICSRARQGFVWTHVHHYKPTARLEYCRDMAQHLLGVGDLMVSNDHKNRVQISRQFGVVCDTFYDVDVAEIRFLDPFVEPFKGTWANVFGENVAVHAYRARQRDFIITISRSYISNFGSIHETQSPDDLRHFEIILAFRLR